MTLLGDLCKHRSFRFVSPIVSWVPSRWVSQGLIAMVQIHPIFVRIRGVTLTRICAQRCLVHRSRQYNFFVRNVFLGRLGMRDGVESVRFGEVLEDFHVSCVKLC